MATRSEYETLHSEWKRVTEEYDKRREAMPPGSLQSEITLNWLLYKSSEADLIRRHGWTVLEFETETHRVELHRSEVQDAPNSERGETW